MSVFHQIGHASINLVNEERLSQFKGMVCSPVNYSEAEITSQIKNLPKSFISILDPQLYFPLSERGKLQTWSYFPNDFETADQSNHVWWEKICDLLNATCSRIGCSHICSPVFVPSKFSSEYYKFGIDIGNYLYSTVRLNNIGFYQTAIIDFNNIKEVGEAETIASVLSQTEGDSIYLIIKSDSEPRRELSNADSITGVMKLIRLLADASINVFVAFCSSEFILWKYAGAKCFATGKFFNLRRFTSSRFDDPSGGGGQLPYWFEKNLVAYLREGDLVRLEKENLLHKDYEHNPFSVEILEQLRNSPGTAWLALSWKNYLYNFAELSSKLNTQDSISDLLVIAEKNWRSLEDDNILMEESRNDGTWIRPWRIAINNFNKAFN